MVLRSILVLLKTGSSKIGCEFREDVLKSTLSTLRFYDFFNKGKFWQLSFPCISSHLSNICSTPEKRPKCLYPCFIYQTLPIIPTFWKVMHYIKPWVHYLAPEIHNTLFWIWSLFIALFLWRQVLSWVTIIIPHLALGSLTKEHRARSNYKEQAECQQTGKMWHLAASPRRRIKKNHPK